MDTECRAEQKKINPITMSHTHTLMVNGQEQHIFGRSFNFFFSLPFVTHTENHGNLSL